MKVLISLESGLSDSSAPSAAGELTIAGGKLTVSWTQPPEGEEKCESLHKLSYNKREDELHIERIGDNTTDLFFSPKTRTHGLLTTPYGDFAMDIETKHLSVPEELWHVSDEAPDVFSGNKTYRQIQLSYFLLLSDQEPIQNDISIQISLEKNEDKG